MICPKCGMEMPDNAKFCGKCGHKLEQKAFCMNCGTELIPGMAFCAACGTKVGAAPSSAQRNVEPPMSPVENTREVIPVSNEKPMVHIQWAASIIGEVKITTKTDSSTLDLYHDRLSFKNRFKGNYFGLLGIAVSAAKNKGSDMIDIPYDQIAEITYGKPRKGAGMFVNVILTDGNQLHFGVAPLNKTSSGSDHINNEELYNRLLKLAQPYMK